MNEFEKDIRRNATEIEGFSDADFLEACEEVDSKEKTNKIEKVENNMDYIKCSEKELTAIEKVMEGLQEFVNVTTSESDLSYDIQMTNDHKLDNLIYDIKNNELFENWLIFKEGVTKVKAYDTSGTGAEIIDILHNNYDKVFGRYEEGGEHIYFISESRENWNEEREEDEIHFMVEETPVSMNDCVRHDV